jgi:hypothetical protein
MCSVVVLGQANYPSYSIYHHRLTGKKLRELTVQAGSSLHLPGGQGLRDRKA